MWVIYETESGVEWDRYEHFEDADIARLELNAFSYYDHYTVRWEA